MTNLEAFKVKLDDVNVQDASVSALLTFYNIDPSAEFVISKTNPINCDFYRLLIERKLSISNVRSMSEGGFSITYNNVPDYLKQLASSLAYESGCSSLISKYGSYGATIKDISGMLDR